MGIVHAVGERLVRNIEGEIAIFRHFHIVGGFGEFAFLHRFHHSGGAIGERILKILVGGLLVGKTHASISPCLLAALFSVGVLGEVAIIIHNHFHRVHITLTRVKHVGTCIFEHRHHIGKHITHGVKVLDGLEQARALPFPAVDFWLVVQAVAVPHGYQIAIKCLGVAARRTHFGDKWFVLAHKLLREGVKILFHIVAIHGDIHLLHFGIVGKLGFDASLQFAHKFGREINAREIIGEVNLEAVARLCERIYLHIADAHVRFHHRTQHRKHALTLGLAHGLGISHGAAC